MSLPTVAAAAVAEQVTGVGTSNTVPAPATPGRFQPLSAHEQAQHLSSTIVDHRTSFGSWRLSSDASNGDTLVFEKCSNVACVEKRVAAEDGQSRVYDDVFREARLMRMLGLEAASPGAVKRPAVGEEVVDRKTCGLGDRCFDDASGSLRTDVLRQLQAGQKLCTRLVAEYTEAGVHHLVTEFHTGGDLQAEMNRLIRGADRTTAFVDLAAIRAREDVARAWMQQLCLAVQFLHAHSVAHLDVAFENVCLDEYGHARLIDLGAATRHPEATPADILLSRGVTLASAPLPDAENCRRCAACGLDSAELQHRSSRAAQVAATVHPSLALKAPTGSVNRFLVRPFCLHRPRVPGRPAYASLELHNASKLCVPVNPYKCDVSALGVVLFTMVACHLPFQEANPKTDIWFANLLDSRWLHPTRYKRPAAQQYANLSPNVLALIDAMLKPQAVVPSIDQVLAHPWFQADHPENTPILRVASDSTPDSGGSIQC
jgi:serine/threonine protein kinase